MKFEEWFLEQFGKRPFVDSHTISKLRENVRVAEYNLDVAKRQLQEQEVYDIRIDAAYKAWLAKEN